MRLPVYNVENHRARLLKRPKTGGIVGLMTRGGFSIGRMRSHVDDRLPNGEAVFSRDCPELTRPEDAGPDHAAVWVDLDI